MVPASPVPLSASITHFPRRGSGLGAILPGAGVLPFPSHDGRNRTEPANSPMPMRRRVLLNSSRSIIPTFCPRVAFRGTLSALSVDRAASKTASIRFHQPIVQRSPHVAIRNALPDRPSKSGGNRSARHGAWHGRLADSSGMLSALTTLTQNPG